jgi:RNA polymerase sigma factor (TIGR02999 family)
MDVTVLLKRLQSGDRSAENDLLPLVYDELRRIAAWHLRSERADHTLQPTAIVHETYLRLRGYKVQWNDRSHFFAIAGRVMRHVLVDYARQRQSRKRGSDEQLVESYAALMYVHTNPDKVLFVDQALDRLAEQDPRMAQIVELRFFGGLSIRETADVLQLSDRTVKRDWNAARAILHAQLGPATVD